MENNSGLSIVNSINAMEIGGSFYSFIPSSKEDKILLYNALNNPTKKIGDCINQVIEVKDVVISYVELQGATNQSDPNPFVPEEVRDRTKNAYRVVLIDKDGASYTAASAGIINSIRNLAQIFGTLHFDEPMPVTVRQVAAKNGKTLTLEL